MPKLWVAWITLYQLDYFLLKKCLFKDLILVCKVFMWLSSSEVSWTLLWFYRGGQPNTYLWDWVQYEENFCAFSLERQWILATFFFLLLHVIIVSNDKQLSVYSNREREKIWGFFFILKLLSLFLSAFTFKKMLFFPLLFSWKLLSIFICWFELHFLKNITLMVFKPTWHLFKDILSISSLHNLNWG